MDFSWLDNLWKETQNSLNCGSERTGIPGSRKEESGSADRGLGSLSSPGLWGAPESVLGPFNPGPPEGPGSTGSFVYDKKSDVSIGGRHYSPPELPKSIGSDIGADANDDQYGAIGLIMRRLSTADGGRWRVMSVCPGSPASTSGKIRAGMTLTHVDGEELNFQDAAAAGAPGTDVELSFLSNRTQREMELLNGEFQEAKQESEETTENDADASPKSKGDHLIKIDITLKRMDPMEFVEEDAEMRRFRRLGCTRNSLNIRV